MGAQHKHIQPSDLFLHTLHEPHTDGQVLCLRLKPARQSTLLRCVILIFHAQLSLIPSKAKDGVLYLYVLESSGKVPVSAP